LDALRDVEPAYRKEEALRWLYFDEGLSQYDIADLYDVSVSTISYWFDKHDISTETHGSFQITDQGSDATDYPRWREYVDGEQYWHRLARINVFVVSEPADVAEADEVHHRFPTGVAIDVPSNLEPLDSEEHRGITHPSQTDDPDEIDTATAPEEVGIGKSEVPLSAVEGLHRSRLELPPHPADETPTPEKYQRNPGEPNGGLVDADGDAPATSIP
jgi:hypothetical protein